MRHKIGNADNPVLVGTPAGAADRLSVKVRDDIMIIKIEDIIFLKADKAKTVLVTKNGSYSSRSGLSFWEKKLQESGFIRCHRSFIVNAAYIKSMMHILGEYKELVLDFCDVNIPVSRQKVGAVKRWMGIV